VFARELAAFAGWAQGTRPLCALVDIDFSPAAERAVHWVERLAMVGPCELVAAHQYMSSRAAGASAAAGLQTYASEGRVRASLERELRAFVGPLQGDLVLRSRLEPARQPHADALANMALDERADLLAFAVDVHDSRARRLATRMVGEALSRASCCVLCVPASDPRAAS
jgi:nucleotide-binding universal stress UspA family protein